MQNRITSKLPATERWSESGRDGALGSPISPSMKQRARRAEQRVEGSIKTHPAIYLGTALLAGIALGWWIKRS